MKEKSAGFAILNELPGAKPVTDGDKITRRECDEAIETLTKVSGEADEWLSIWNDALFTEL